MNRGINKEYSVKNFIQIPQVTQANEKSEKEPLCQRIKVKRKERRE